MENIKKSATKKIVKKNKLDFTRETYVITKQDGQEQTLKQFLRDLVKVGKRVTRKANKRKS